MRLRIFRNTNRVAMALGHMPDHEVVEVYAYDDTTAPHHVAACEQAFELFDIGDDPNFGPPDKRAIEYRRRGNRSLSVGDGHRLRRPLLHLRTLRLVGDRRAPHHQPHPARYDPVAVTHRRPSAVKSAGRQAR
jgi:hypothetical protein